MNIVVRFSLSIPDVALTIDAPTKTTVAALRQRIRAALQPPASNARLRLIHSGRVLAERAAISQCLAAALPLNPPRSEKAQGKLPVTNVNTIPTPSVVYIHCAIGDVLAPLELSAEANAAAEADILLQNPIEPTGASSQEETQHVSTTTPAPRGFDRLLSAGFTATEVASLRTQFLAIQAHTHTPDTMPTAPELLALEERWLDHGSDSVGPGADGNTGGHGADDTGGLEDILYGNLVGFFWPLGAMCWLMREEGVWSRRRQIAVLSGFFVNIIFGCLRILN